jgi:hypothetical protein
MIKKMEILGIVNGLQINNKVEEFCHGCAHGNNHIKSFLDCLVHQKSYELGHLIHTNVCGPMNVESNVGCRYYVLFKDDCINY